MTLAVKGLMMMLDGPNRNREQGDLTWAIGIVMK